jgi:hypothetical protein
LLRNQLVSSGESASCSVADAIKKRTKSEWPPDVVALLGSWKDSDFPDPEEIRKGYGTDVPRETF